MRLFLIILLLLFSFPALATEQDPLSDETGMPLERVQAYIVEGPPSKDYAALKKDAEAFAKKTGRKFETLDRIYDKEKGLIYPKDYKGDEIYAGEYYPRRDIDNDNPSISIERYSYYRDDNEKDTRMVLTFGIFTDKAKAEALKKKLSADVPGVTINDVPGFYLGCMH